MRNFDGYFSLFFESSGWINQLIKRKICSRSSDNWNILFLCIYILVYAFSSTRGQPPWRNFMPRTPAGLRAWSLPPKQWDGAPQSWCKCQSSPDCLQQSVKGPMFIMLAEGNLLQTAVITLWILKGPKNEGDDLLPLLNLKMDTVQHELTRLWLFASPFWHILSVFLQLHQFLYI